MKRLTNANRRSTGCRSMSRLFAAGLAAVVSVESARAEYQDPLDTPAQIMPSAPQSLLLDITQVNDRLVAVGERGHILFSDNHGNDWQQSEVAVRTQLNAVFFVDDKQGWAVGEDAAIVHTDNGGLSWQKQFDARNAEIQGPLSDVYFKNANEGYAVGVFDKLYRTEDGGETWQDWSDHANNPDEWHFFAIAATDADTLYIASEVGLLFRSLDGGDSFEPLQTDHNGSFHGILAKRAPDGSDWLILSGVGGKLFTSKDGGENWRELETRTEMGLAGGTWLADGSALVVGTEGVMLHVSADLASVKKYQRENGLPLSSVVQQSPDSYVMVGLGGIQDMTQLPGR